MPLLDGPLSVARFYTLAWYMDALQNLVAMPSELFNPLSAYSEIKNGLSQLYLSDPRPWLVGFSGGKDSTLVAALVFEAALGIPAAQRTMEIHVVCTDSRSRFQRCSNPMKPASRPTGQR